VIVTLPDLALTRLEPSMEDWSEQVDRLRALVGAPTNPALFPAHFLKATFPKLGGRLLLFQDGAGPVAVGFAFPAGFDVDRPRYVVRLHHAAAARAGSEALARLAGEALGGARITLFDSERPHAFVPTDEMIDGISYGAPSAREAEAMRALQGAVWGAEEDSLYPADLHATDFGASTSLVARDGERTVGFLFGFYKLEGSPLPAAWHARHPQRLRIESQLLGVLPEYRERQIGFGLKRLQAGLARRAGVAVVQWTVDPLQFANARFNFARLGAVGFEFYPSYYEFRNALNRVPASRIGITWLVGSARVLGALAAAESPLPDLADARDVARVTPGSSDRHALADAERVAIEIPANWTGLQHTDAALALRLRRETDELFATWLGSTPDKLVLAGVARDGSRRFLLAQRAGDELLALVGA